MKDLVRTTRQLCFDYASTHPLVRSPALPAWRMRILEKGLERQRQSKERISLSLSLFLSRSLALSRSLSSSFTTGRRLQLACLSSERRIC